MSVPFVDTSDMVRGADKHRNAAFVRIAPRQVLGDVKCVSQVHALDWGVTNDLLAINKYPASYHVILLPFRLRAKDCEIYNSMSNRCLNETDGSG